MTIASGKKWTMLKILSWTWRRLITHWSFSLVQPLVLQTLSEAATALKVSVWHQLLLQNPPQMVQNLAVHLLFNKPKVTWPSSPHGPPLAAHSWMNQIQAYALSGPPRNLVWFCHPSKQGSLSPDCSNWWFHDAGTSYQMLSEQRCICSENPSNSNTPYSLWLWTRSTGTLSFKQNLMLTPEFLTAASEPETRPPSTTRRHSSYHNSVNTCVTSLWKITRVKYSREHILSLTIFRFCQRTF